VPQNNSTYFSIMKETDYTPHIRRRLVHEVEQSSRADVARRWGMSRRIVTKWYERFKEEGYEGLRDRSRAPKASPAALSEESRAEIKKLDKNYPTVGAARLKRMLGLSYAVKTIRKVWREEGLRRPRKRKHVTKVNLREIKKQYRLGEQIQMDTKDLNDIPEMYASLVAHNLPLVQYTARDVTSGTQWLSYARQRSLINSSVFAARILSVLADSGVSPESVTVQTDNGSEFIGNVSARQDSLFTHLIEGMGATHKTIPPGYKTYQADVETAHNLIEDELYRIENFVSLAAFLRKANAYQHWFNILRDNSYKEYQTPWQIVMNKQPKAKAELALLPAILLDEHPIVRKFMREKVLRKTTFLDTLLRAYSPDHHVGYLPNREGSRGDGTFDSRRPSRARLTSRRHAS
jgi:transposase